MLCCKYFPASISTDRQAASQVADVVRGNMTKTFVLLPDL